MLYSNVLSKLMYKCIKKVPVTVVKTEFLKHFSKQMSVYFLFLYISVRMSLFQRHSKILSSGGGGFGVRQNNFPKAARCFTIFYFN